MFTSCKAVIWIYNIIQISFWVSIHKTTFNFNHHTNHREFSKKNRALRAKSIYKKHLLTLSLQFNKKTYCDCLRLYRSYWATFKWALWRQIRFEFSCSEYLWFNLNSIFYWKSYRPLILKEAAFREFFCSVLYRLLAGGSNLTVRCIPFNS